jgi:hypothetical protein
MSEPTITVTTIPAYAFVSRRLLDDMNRVPTEAERRASAAESERLRGELVRLRAELTKVTDTLSVEILALHSETDRGECAECADEWGVDWPCSTVLTVARVAGIAEPN